MVQGQQLSSNFGAFISYSHADSAIAKKLHRALETYRLPKALRKLDENDNSKIGPIFRDKEDLPAGNDLSEAVKKALSQSCTLIILCSPEAQKSSWVAREIALFRELHPEKPILAALIAGEPEQAFPFPLIEGGREPLAADLRKEGDGWKLGLLKLIAGIAHVPLDALIQRDAQRKLKHVTVITLLTGLALIAMTLMTAYAIQARQEAQHQKIQAEELIIFMLRDLRDELKGASTLRVMTKVNQEAMEYFTSQGDISNLDDDSLSLVAETLRALGEDHEKRGDLDTAIEPFEQAHRFTAELLERNPSNPNRIFDHAQSEYWIGRVDELQQDYPAAQQRYNQYATLANRLHMLENDSKRALLERAYAASNLGILEHKNFNNNIEARNHFEKAISWFEKAFTREPEDQNILAELANAYAWFADTFYREQDYDSALAARKKEVQLKSKLVRTNPDNADMKMKLLISERAIALVEAKLGKKAIARKRLNSALVQAKKLLELDAENAERRKIYRLIQESLETLK